MTSSFWTENHHDHSVARPSHLHLTDILASMPQLIDIGAMVLVGSLWGCTNPVLRRASMEHDSDTDRQPTHPNPSGDKSRSLFQRVITTLAGFRRVQIYLPYLCNQLGSLAFYFVLSRTDLSLAVPACNALALVFSILTSRYLGERGAKPLQTLTGSALIVTGVTICLLASTNSTSSSSTAS